MGDGAAGLASPHRAAPADGRGLVSERRNAAAPTAALSEDRVHGWGRRQAREGQPRTIGKYGSTPISDNLDRFHRTERFGCRSDSLSPAMLHRPRLANLASSSHAILAGQTPQLAGQSHHPILRRHRRALFQYLEQAH